MLKFLYGRTVGTGLHNIVAETEETGKGGAKIPKSPLKGDRIRGNENSFSFFKGRREMDFTVIPAKTRNPGD